MKVSSAVARATSQTMTVASSPAVTRKRPSGVKRTSRTGASWRPAAVRARPVRRSRTRTEPSSPPAANGGRRARGRRRPRPRGRSAAARSVRASRTTTPLPCSTRWLSGVGRNAVSRSTVTSRRPFGVKAAMSASDPWPVIDADPVRWPVRPSKRSNSRRVGSPGASPVGRSCIVTTSRPSGEYRVLMNCVSSWGRSSAATRRPVRPSSRSNAPKPPTSTPRPVRAERESPGCRGCACGTAAAAGAGWPDRAMTRRRARRRRPACARRDSGPVWLSRAPPTRETRDRRRAAQQRGQQVAARLQRVVERDALARQQQRAVEVVLDERLRAEALRRRRCAPRRARSRVGRGRARPPRPSSTSSAATPASRARRRRLVRRALRDLALALAAAVVDERALDRVELAGVLGAPVERRGQPRAAVELARIAPAARPTPARPRRGGGARGGPRTSSSSQPRSRGHSRSSAS